jgi:hypothetical protein
MGQNGDGQAVFLQGENIGSNVFRSGNVVVQPLEGGREGRVVIRRFGDDN